MDHQDNIIPISRRLTVSDDEINELTAITHNEIIDRLKTGENLAFIKTNDDSSIDLTVYFLSTIGNDTIETESVFERTERLIKIAPKEKTLLSETDDEYGMYKSVFTLKPDETDQVQLNKDDLDRFADIVSRGVAERLDDGHSIEKGKLPMYEYDVFLSYSRYDKDEARQIQQVLEENEISYFLDEKSIIPGDKWQDSLRDHLKACNHCITLVTPNSLASEWVLSEWTIAWALEKTIIPVLLRCDTTQLPDRLKQYQAVDFHRLSETIPIIFEK